MPIMFGSYDEYRFNDSYRSQTSGAGSAQPAKHAYADANGKFEDEPYTFWDFLDIINPLQHIPIVSSIYRELTGDEMRGPANIIGGMLFGGPIGMISGMVSTVAEEATGKSPEEQIVSLITGEDDAGAATAGTATAGTATAGTATAGTATASTAQVADASARVGVEAIPLLEAAPPAAVGDGAVDAATDPAATSVAATSVADATRVFEASAPGASIAGDAGLDAALSALAAGIGSDDAAQASAIRLLGAVSNDAPAAEPTLLAAMGRASSAYGQTAQTPLLDRVF